MEDDRIRLRFAKSGAARFLSHLDLLRVIERALRRARIPVGYSRGFHPRPRVSVPFALPLGMEAEREILEIRLAGPGDPASLARALQKELPRGLEVREACRVASFRKPRRVRAIYRLAARHGALPPLARWIEIARSGDLPRGDLVREFRAQGEGIVLEAEIVEGRGVRPRELLAALDLDPALVRVTREDLRWEEPVEDGARERDAGEAAAGGASPAG